MENQLEKEVNNFIELEKRFDNKLLDKISKIDKSLEEIEENSFQLIEKIKEL